MIHSKVLSNLMFILLAWQVPVLPAAELHTFTLHGGHFYGPGPIVPDTPLPDGSIRNIHFDTDKLTGYAEFGASGKTISDGKTTTNGNIDAGTLEIGGVGKKGKAFWLYAVAGGPNQGQERYAFDANYNMVWTVDVALDPNFPEGIVRVNDFQLTTGTVTVPLSLQTQQHIPEGYDKAGSLSSGSTLTGRVGDFDADGLLDGIIVAAANVPMAADMLPGAPVGNKRGFRTDIPIKPLFALELTLHGIANLKPLLDKYLAANQLEFATHTLTEIRQRVITARTNYESGFIAAAASERKDLREIGWRLESIHQMFYIPWAFLVTYKFPAGTPNSILDATQRAMDKTQALAAFLEHQRLKVATP